MVGGGFASGFALDDGHTTHDELKENGMMMVMGRVANDFFGESILDPRCVRSIAFFVLCGGGRRRRPSHSQQHTTHGPQPHMQQCILAPRRIATAATGAGRIVVWFSAAAAGHTSHNNVILLILLLPRAHRAVHRWSLGRCLCLRREQRHAAAAGVVAPGSGAGSSRGAAGEAVDEHVGGEGGGW